MIHHLEMAKFLCYNSGCEKNPEDLCTEPHSDPISLPALPEIVLTFYKDIVDECRAVDPNERTSAWQLLKKFPSDSSQTVMSPQVEGREISLSVLDAQGHGVMVFCDICDAETTEHCFHCVCCSDSNFNYVWYA